MKWQVIRMDFVEGLPMSHNKYNVILVHVDKLTKVAHFILGNVIDGALVIAHKFVQEFFRLHGIPKKIISDRDAKFTSNFWREIFTGLEMKLAFSVAYHLQVDGKTERTNRILEDMLRMYVMHRPKKWEEYLLLAGF